MTTISRRTFLEGLGTASTLTIVPRRVLGGPRFVPPSDTILLAQVIMGIGYTFVEGAIEAWLTDEVGEERVGQILLRAGQVGRVAGFVGIGASVAIASLRLNLPLVVAGVLFLAFGGYLVIAMRETRFRRPVRNGAARWQERVRDSFGEMARTTILAGQRVMPKVLLRNGFHFAHPTLEEALRFELAR